MNQSIYNTNQLKIEFILSYMNDGEAANWKEYYLDTLEDLNMRMPNFPTLVTFLADVRKAFRAADWVQDAVNRLETFRQGKKTAEELNMEFLQIVGQAGMDRKTPSDHLHFIGYYKKMLEFRLSRRILFSDDVPKMIDRYYNLSLTSSLTLHLHFTFSFSNLAYLISLSPGHESLIYDLFYLSLTHVHHFDSP
jgi:hypothetical protein